MTTMMYSRISRLVWLFILLLFPQGIQAARDCISQNVPISLVALDNETGQYVLVSDQDILDTTTFTNIDTDGGARHLMGQEGSTQGIFVVENRKMQQAFSNQTVAFMHRCPCSRDGRSMYCPREAPMCFVPRRDEVTGWCTDISFRRSFLKAAWPFLWLWNLIVLVGMLTSRHGRAAIVYVFSCCIPSINRQYVEYLLQRQPDRANEYLRFYDRRNRERNLGGPIVLPVGFDFNRFFPAENTTSEATNNAHQKPTSLVLKTRRYTAPENTVPEIPTQATASHDNDDDALTCTICFVPIDDGDRIGDLPCQHTFHVDCLKIWLTRRAICPLCQSSDVVTPQYNPPPAVAMEATSLSLVEESTEAASV